MSVDLSQFVGEFLQESYEGLDLMESCLLQYDGDPEAVDGIFRAAHSIKGGAGTFGFNQISDFTHNVETILDEMRNDEILVTDDIVNTLLESVDILRNLLKASQGEEQVDEQLTLSVEQRLKAFINSAVDGAHDHESVSSENDPSENKVSGVEKVTRQDDCDISGDQKNIDCSDWLIEFEPHLNMLQSGNEPLFIFAELAELGSLKVIPNIVNLPDLDDADVENIYITWLLKLTPDSQASLTHDQLGEEIKEIFEWVEDFCTLSISAPTLREEKEEPSVIENTVVEVAPSIVEQESKSKLMTPLDVQDEIVEVKKKAKTSISSSQTNSIRVDTERLDELMNRVGELVVTQAMLTQAGTELSKAGYHNFRLEQGLTQLESNTRDLQADVMRMRMLPISFVFNRFARLVHDVGLSLGKKVRLEISGNQTEIDKTVMEKIGDPLTHLIRNALDHAIEMPAERIAAGKPEIGTISLNAYHKNGFVVIDIIDDGKGLDASKIRKKALENNLISEDQNLSDDEIHALIFKAGFSTADKLTELSGRGVGMDVVMSNIESIGGQVNLSTKLGQGTTFSVRAPLTLAIIEGQLVKVGEESYVIPLVAIKETILLNRRDIKNLGPQNQFINYRDQYVQLIDLDQLFNKNSQLAEVETNEADVEMPLIIIIVMESAGAKAGFIVDELEFQQQFVVKPLEANFKKIQGVVGGTIMGDGNVALIIDSSGIISKHEKINNVVPINTGLAS